MAIEKTIESPQGVPCAYHRITHLQITWSTKSSGGVISSFYTKEARDSGKGAIENVEFSISPKEFQFDGVYLDVKQILKMSESQNLIGVKLFFDGPIVHIDAAYTVDVFGKDFNQNMQLSAPKQALPDFLKSIYEKIVEITPYKD